MRGLRNEREGRSWGMSWAELMCTKAVSWANLALVGCIVADLKAHR